jgi:hypothetical protein
LRNLKNELYARVYGSQCIIQTEGHISVLLYPEDVGIILLVIVGSYIPVTTHHISVRHYKYMEYVLSALYYTNTSTSSKRTPALNGNIFVSLVVPLKIGFSVLRTNCTTPDGRIFDARAIRKACQFL